MFDEFAELTANIEKDFFSTKRTLELREKCFAVNKRKRRRALSWLGHVLGELLLFALCTEFNVFGMTETVCIWAKKEAAHSSSRQRQASAPSAETHRGRAANTAVIKSRDIKNPLLKLRNNVFGEDTANIEKFSGIAQSNIIFVDSRKRLIK